MIVLNIALSAVLSPVDPSRGRGLFRAAACYPCVIARSTEPFVAQRLVAIGTRSVRPYRRFSPRPNARATAQIANEGSLGLRAYEPRRDACNRRSALDVAPNHRARANQGAFADRHTAQDHRAGSKRRPTPDTRDLEIPVRGAL
jgi:hypothetical protein